MQQHLLIRSKPFSDPFTAMDRLMNRQFEFMDAQMQQVRFGRRL